MPVERNLLKWLFDVKEGNRVLLRAGVVTNTAGKPILSLHRNLFFGNRFAGETLAEEDVGSFLHLLVSNPELCEARVNALVRGEVVSPLPDSGTHRSGPRRPPGAFVPVISEARDVPVAVLAVAFTTATEQGDCLADRATVCAKCGRYFISKTKIRPKFCSRKCSNAMAQERRKLRAKQHKHNSCP